MVFKVLVEDFLAQVTLGVLPGQVARVQISAGRIPVGGAAVEKELGNPAEIRLVGRLEKQLIRVVVQGRLEGSALRD